MLDYNDDFSYHFINWAVIFAVWLIDDVDERDDAADDVMFVYQI